MAQSSQNPFIAKQTEKLIESQLVKAAQILEDNLDQEINRLEKLDEDDIEAIRQRRLQQMKEDSRQRSDWLAKGHGTYTELADEREFFNASKASTFGFVCHFYRDSTFRCKIVDKHLALLAPKHIECRMVKLNAEKAPFLTQRLGVIVIPTLILVKNEQICDRIIGFDELGGHDEFSTEMLEWRLALGKVIKYNGDLSIPPDSVKKNKSAMRIQERKTIRGPVQGDDEDEDELSD